MRAAATMVYPEIMPIPFPKIGWPICTAPRKRNICVFDPLKDVHQRMLKSILGDLVDIHWFNKFSAESLEKGELSENEYWDSIVRFNPVMLVVELKLLLAHPNWRDGVKLLENFRRSQEFNTGVEVTVISSADVILAAQKDCERLGVDWYFCWDSFYTSPAQRLNLRHRISRLL